MTRLRCIPNFNCGGQTLIPESKSQLKKKKVNQKTLFEKGSKEFLVAGQEKVVVVVIHETMVMKNLLVISV